ncbi:MAG: hypothetical protein A3A57_02765 [Candidatus Woykebacteria bacterium RIFCSPLOWO2_01_FULL_41_12]|uniref:DNA helicase UvrD n=1 Tax=Candidatus Woykebacteria bacterium RIFCSPLOWO2_01_FULL_41_12 TaxID=1802604 RepID=A0A1G1WWR0_9BACT|nr:MAG: hypothetical protein A3A57_02765 [Candidatus Woykebacteria bacterium RIFCSPLOWO2_01_FULL_41_12]
MSKFVADLHTHSSYARATSPRLNFDTLSTWAKLKGVQLLSSADFTHPVWWQEIKRNLKESEYDGFYQHNGINFVLGTEISCIYTQGGRQRRTHCLLFFPEKKDVAKFNNNLGQRANLSADGRPIVGLSARQLLELALGINEKTILIPAHVWTPWFSLYGSNSGFDSIEECFGSLSKYIYAVETGLSSDPAMNWRIKELDSRSIVSFSDLHSGPKMAREATVFDTDFSYEGLFEALRKQKVSLTVEFFPEEGKYHYTGHRNCKIRHSPSESDKLGFTCPKCQRKLTIGVMHRVSELAEQSRSEDYIPKNRPPFKRLVPLFEILAEVFNVQSTSQKVIDEYNNLVNRFGSELGILLKTPLEDLERGLSIYKIVEGIGRVRRGNIVVDPGYDGVYGTVKIWNFDSEPTRRNSLVNQKLPEGQVGLFD